MSEGPSQWSECIIMSETFGVIIEAPLGFASASCGPASGCAEEAASMTLAAAYFAVGSLLAHRCPAQNHDVDSNRARIAISRLGDAPNSTRKAKSPTWPTPSIPFSW